MVCVSGFLFLLFILTKGRGIGGGDIKLMFAAGLLLGWQKIILALMIGCIVGSIIHLILMKVSDKGRMLAFGPYLSAGIFISILFGDKLITWYLGTLN
jgi:leader peptidase (prepilin peptidase)/N-methyltransferase